jgi:hypothetical protein
VYLPEQGPAVGDKNPRNNEELSKIDELDPILNFPTTNTILK